MAHGTSTAIGHSLEHGHGGPPSGVARRTTATQDFVRGVWRENPVFRQFLGLCPALAVTNTLANSLAMGVATLVVLVGSSLLVSAFKRSIPEAVRLATYVLIIATWVTVADLIMQALVPDIEKALGAYVYLIVVNCIILARQEAFASRQPIGRSLLDAAGTGLGNGLTPPLMGTPGGMGGVGGFPGLKLFAAPHQPWAVMQLPPGGFFAIGVILLAIAWLTRLASRRAAHVSAHHEARAEAA